MAQRETRVLYKALADYSDLKKAMLEAKQAVKELREEEKKGNKESEERAKKLRKQYDALTTAVDNHTTAIDGNSKAVKANNKVMGVAADRVGRVADETQRAADATTSLRTRAKNMGVAMEGAGSRVEAAGNKIASANDKLDEASSHVAALATEVDLARDKYAELGMTAASTATTVTRKMKLNTEVERSGDTGEAVAGGLLSRLFGRRTTIKRKVKFEADTSNLVGGLRATFNAAGSVSEKLREIGNWRPRLTPPFIALVPIIAAVIAVINPLIAGISALGIAAGALVTNLGSVAPAALAIAPALAGLLSGVAATKMAFGGIGSAFKELADARKKADEDAGVTAFDRLTPSAQNFVRTIDGLVTKWREMKAVLQENFFSVATQNLDKMPGIIDSVGAALGPAATSMGRFFDNVVKLVGGSEWSRDMAWFGEQNATALDDVGDAGVHLLDIFRLLTVGAMPTWQRFASAVSTGAGNIRAALDTAVSSGRFQEWMSEVADRTAQWWRILKNVGSTIADLTRALAPLSGWMVDGLEDMTRGWHRFWEAARQPGSDFQQYLGSLKPLLQEINGLFGDFFGWFGETATDPGNIIAMIELIQLVRDELGPAISSILQTLTDSGIAQSFVTTLTAIFETIDAVIKNGGADAFRLFLESIELAFTGLANVMNSGGLIGNLIAFASGLAAIGASMAFLTKFLGINAAVTAFRDVIAGPRFAAGLAGLTTFFANSRLGQVAATGITKVRDGLVQVGNTHPRLQAVTTQLGKMGGAVRGLAAGLAGGVIGLGITAAVVGIDLLISKLSEANSSAAEWQSAVANPNMTTEGLFAMTGQVNSIEALRAGLERLSNTDLPTWLVGGESNVLAGMEDQISSLDGFNNNIQELGRNLKDMYAINAEGALDAIGMLSEDLGTEGMTEMIARSSDLRDVLTEVALAQGVFVGGMSEADRNAALAGIAAQLQADGMIGLANAYDEATAAVDRYNSMFANMSNAQAAFDQSMIDAPARIEELKAQWETLGSIIDPTTGQLSRFTEAGIAARQELTGLATDGLASVQALADLDAGTAAVAAEMGTAFNAFVQTAQGAGLSEAAARGLAAQYGLMPSDVYTALENNSPDARRLVEEYIASTEGIPDSVVTAMLAEVAAAEQLLNATARNRTATITVTTANGGTVTVPGRGSAEWQGPGYSDGGVIPGTPSVQDNRFAHVASGEYVVRTRQSLKHRGLLDAVNDDRLDEYLAASAGYRPTMSAPSVPSSSAGSSSSIAAAAPSGPSTHIENVNIYNPIREETVESMARTTRKLAYT